LEVFDRDQTSADDRLGFVEVPVEALLSGRKEERWLRLVLAQEFRRQLRAIKVRPPWVPTPQCRSYF
jgi:hypothetical protein